MIFERKTIMNKKYFIDGDDAFPQDLEDVAYGEELEAVDDEEEGDEE